MGPRDIHRMCCDLPGRRRRLAREHRDDFPYGSFCRDQRSHRCTTRRTDRSQ